LLFLALLLVQARATASEALYDGQPVPHWQAALKDSDPKIRRRAAYALGQVGPPAATAAVSDLSTALADRHVEVAWYAADALGRIGPKAAPAVKALIGVIEETPGDAVLRRNAVIALGRIGPEAKEALSSLETQAKSADGETRVAAGVAQWKITSRPDALATVIAALRPAGEPSAFAAALALRGVKEPGVITALVKLLDSTDDDLRRAATESLGQSGTSAIDPLIGVVQMSSATSERTQVAAVTAMGQILGSLREQLRTSNEGDQKSNRTDLQRDLQRIVAAMIERLGNPSDRIQAAAVRSLSQAGEFGVGALTKALLAENARVAEGARLVIGFLEVNLPAADTVADAGSSEKAIPELTAALTHGDPPTRAAGFRLFAMLSIRNASDTTKDALRAGLGDPDADIRRCAAASLARLEN